MFQVAQSLASTYTKEWKTWNTERSQQLQRNARVHLSRKILQEYSGRINECEIKVTKHRHQTNQKLVRKVLHAWGIISQKRFSFRAFLIRCRNILQLHKKESIFESWKCRTFDPKAILWRQKYYTLVLTGWKSRRKRMIYYFQAWKVTYVSLSLFIKARQLRNLKSYFILWHSLRRYLGQGLHLVITLQQWYHKLHLRKMLKKKGMLLLFNKKKERKEYLAKEKITKNNSIVTIQKCWKKYQLQKYLKFIKAIVTIQSCCRKKTAIVLVENEKLVVDFRKVYVRKAASKTILKVMVRNSVLKNPFGSCMESYILKEETKKEKVLNEMLMECEDWLVQEKQRVDMKEGEFRRRQIKE